MLIWIYEGVGFWLMLALSILLATVAEYYRSWRIMVISCIVSLPNLVLVVVAPVNLYMYLFVVWFLMQCFMLVMLVKQVTWNRKRFWQGGLLAVVVLYFAYTIITGFPYRVNKTFDEAVYVGNQVVKTVPVKVSGKVYRGIFKTNEFSGDVEIGGQTYSISTFRNRRSVRGMKRDYPYLGVAAVTDSKGYTEPIGTIEISGDFHTVVATTDAISKAYGKEAELAGPELSSRNGN